MNDARIQAFLHRDTGLITSLTNGRHTWSSDVPRQLGSGDSAPDPHDLLDSALAACTVLTLELYLRRKPDWDVQRIDCQVDRISEAKEEDGRVHYRLRRTVSVQGALTEEQRGRLIDIANKCPIHRLMEGQIHVETALSEGRPDEDVGPSA